MTNKKHTVNAAKAETDRAKNGKNNSPEVKQGHVGDRAMRQQTLNESRLYPQE